MSAREDARKVASDKLTNMHLKGPVSYIAEEAADQASNVWEPVVRDLVGVVDDMLRTGGYLTEHREIVARAKEALG